MNLARIFAQICPSLLILAFTISCNGQSAASISSRSENELDSSSVIGDTVSELDKTIFIVFQDKNDNYWFGSDGAGLYRYDGKTILHYSTKDGLLSDKIRGIQEDKIGNIFIATLDGINKFDGWKFTILPVIESDDWKLESDDLWFGILGEVGESGPYRYDGETLYHLRFTKNYMEDEFYETNPTASYNPYDVYTIYKDSKENIWFGTSNLGICRFDGESLSWMYEKHLTITESGGSFGIRSIIEDQEGKFWICNTRNRYEILPSTKENNGTSLLNYKREDGIESFNENGELDFPYFISIVEDEDDLWMATYSDGVWRNDGEKLIHYPIKDGDTDVLLFSIYKDNQGELWLGTHNAGIYKFNGNTFEKFKA